MSFYTDSNVQQDIDLSDLSTAGDNNLHKRPAHEENTVQPTNRNKTPARSMSTGCLHRLGDFRVDLVDGERGGGSFGTVYEGKDKAGNSVAIKKIRVVNMADVSSVMTEINALIKIPRHLNVVQFKDFHFDIPFFWIVMEYCDLGDLQQYVVHNNPNLVIQAGLMLQSARGLHHLHSLDPPMVHRDIKPGNIMLMTDRVGDPVVKIADFGLAKKVDLEQKLANTAILNTQAGTPGFMAPEFFAQAAYTKSVDVFAMGLVFLSMINYKPGNKSLIPVHERCDRICAVGEAMHRAHINGQPQPTLISDHDSDNPLQLGIKKLIRDMCCFAHTDRLRMPEVVKRLETMDPEKRTAPKPVPRQRSVNLKKRNADSTDLHKAAHSSNKMKEPELISVQAETHTNMRTNSQPQEEERNAESTNLYMAAKGGHPSNKMEERELISVQEETLTNIETDSQPNKDHPTRQLRSMKEGFSKKYIRGEIVSLSENVSISESTKNRILEQRAMVTSYNRNEGMVSLVFTTGLKCDLGAETVKTADLSGQMIDEGDMVMVSADRDQLRKLQQRAGEYQPGMEDLSGKAGVVNILNENNTANVQFPSERKAWTVSIQALKLVFKEEELIKMDHAT